MRFDENDKLTGFGLNRQALLAIIESGAPFLTSGCPDCNRPYYNEKPIGPLYNYPRKISQKEKEEIIKLLFDA
jgi:biotin synthase